MIPQCRPNPSGSMQNEDQITPITILDLFVPITKALKRTGTAPESLAPEVSSDPAADTCLKPWSSCFQLWSCKVKLHVLSMQGQHTAPDRCVLLMDSSSPWSTPFTSSFLFEVARSSRSKTPNSTHSEQRHHLVVLCVIELQF